jgi:hypothetical protein
VFLFVFLFVFYLSGAADLAGRSGGFGRITRRIWPDIRRIWPDNR